MIFVGIIEENRKIACEITQSFLLLENYSLIFICSSLEEYKSLPAGKRNKAGVIIIDPGQQNFDRLWQIRYLKQANTEARILFLTETKVNDQLGDKLRKAGVDLFINKNSILKDLAEFFGNRCKGKTNGHTRPVPLPHAILHRQKDEKISLTSREFEIIDLVVKGYTNKKIGERLYISHYTVNAHLRKIYIKLSINSRTALINHIINELV